MSDATVTFALSRDTVTMSPRLPVLPDTLMRSCRNFSCEAMGRGGVGGGQSNGPDYAQSVCLSLSVPCAGHGAAAHEGRSIHDAVIHRLRAVHGELQRLLALHKLLRLLNRLRAEGTARLMASKGRGGRVGSAPPWRWPADCLSARTRRQGAIINEQRNSKSK